MPVHLRTPQSLVWWAASSAGVRWCTDRGVVRVAGEVDAASADTFGTALDVCNGDPTTAALDLTEVTFFSVAGVRCFVEHGWATRPHPIIIASRAVLRVLTLCELDLLLDPHGWRDHAVDMLVPVRVA